MSRSGHLLAGTAAAIAVMLGVFVPTSPHADMGSGALPKVLSPISRGVTPVSPPPTAVPSAGDNMGNHQATQTIILNQHSIHDVKDITVNHIWLGEGTVSGNFAVRFLTADALDMMNGRVRNVQDPSDPADAVNKRYVDFHLVSFG